MCADVWAIIIMNNIITYFTVKPVIDLAKL